MNDKQIQELSEIRDMAWMAAEASETPTLAQMDNDQKLYAMFGSLNADIAKGIGMALNMVLSSVPVAAVCKWCGAEGNNCKDAACLDAIPFGR